jgi:hypothetical protein
VHRSVGRTSSDQTESLTTSRRLELVRSGQSLWGDVYLQEVPDIRIEDAGLGTGDSTTRSTGITTRADSDDEPVQVRVSGWKYLGSGLHLDCWLRSAGTGSRDATDTAWVRCECGELACECSGELEPTPLS